MKELTAERLRELICYDPKDGSFRFRRNMRGHRKAGDRAGARDSNGYWHIKLDGQHYKAHRLACLYVTGAWPLSLMDHLNGNRIDNRWCNLRQADAAINAQNTRRARKDNVSSGLLGVTATPRGAFQARIQVGGSQMSLGVYSDRKAAHQAYVAAKRRLHKGCTL